MVTPISSKTFPNTVNVVLDTTYFGRTFGIMVFKDSISNQILYKQYVKTETNALYLKGIEEIMRRGIHVQAIICDGRKGLFQLFGSIPVQMCQFHQIAIVRRYLTKKPKMQASIALWKITQMMTKTDKESFIGALEEWHKEWKWFLDERVKDSKGKRRYVHKKLRSAYNSLKNNQ